MEIRKLNAGDVKRIAELMAKNFGTIAGELQKHEGESDEEHSSRVGRVVIGQVLAQNLDEIWAWLADLIGSKPSELDQMEPSAPLEIIEAMLEAPELPDFFARVAGLLERRKAG